MLQTLELTLNMHKSQKGKKKREIKSSDIHEFFKMFVTENLYILHGDIFI